MSNFRILLLLLAVALVAGAAGYATRMSTNNEGKAVNAEPGGGNASLSDAAEKPLWYWGFEDLDGEQHLLSEWQGPYLVINFWATWCPPCLKEIPSFVALQNQFSEQQVQFIGVAYDHMEAVRDFVAKTEINYPIMLGGDDVAVFMRELGNKIGALPFTAVVDGNGQVVATHQGEWHQEDAAATLQSLITNEPQ